MSTLRATYPALCLNRRISSAYQTPEDPEPFLSRHRSTTRFVYTSSSHTTRHQCIVSVPILQSQRHRTRQCFRPTSSGIALPDAFRSNAISGSHSGKHLRFGPNCRLLENRSQPFIDFALMSRTTASVEAHGFALDDAHDVRTRERIYLDDNLFGNRSRCLASTDKLKCTKPTSSSLERVLVKFDGARSVNAASSATDAGLCVRIEAIRDRFSCVRIRPIISAEYVLCSAARDGAFRSPRATEIISACNDAKR